MRLTYLVNRLNQKVLVLHLRGSTRCIPVISPDQNSIIGGVWGSLQHDHLGLVAWQEDGRVAEQGEGYSVLAGVCYVCRGVDGVCHNLSS